jgi:hypothetical protein
MFDAKLDNLNQFFNIKNIKILGRLVRVLFCDEANNIVIDLREEVGINFIISKIEDVFDGLDHFGNVYGFEF